MNMKPVYVDCVLVVVLLLGLVSMTSQSYVTPSCRSCLVSGDWPSCTACYSSQPNIVPFYGMGKRSRDTFGFLPGSYNNYRGDSQFGNMFKREDPGFSGKREDPSVGELRKRATFLASYCCWELLDDDCCQMLDEKSSLAVRKRSSSVAFDDADYEMYDDDDCYVCLDSSRFDYEYCLTCVKRR